EDPDVEYERYLSDALKEIEQAAGGEDVAEERIWQITKDEKHRGSESALFEETNSEWEYTLMTDEKAAAFVIDELSTVPEIATIYKSYPYDVLRADLLRYLLLWYYGGFYADMDVFPARPIRQCSALQRLFPPQTDHPANVSLVVGIELDEPYASPSRMHEWHWTRTYGLIQYTMYAPRRFSPLLRQIIVRALAQTRQYQSQHNSLFGYREKDILRLTGPDVFTDTILDMLSSSLPPTHALVQRSVDADESIGDLDTAQKRVTWAPFHGLHETVCIEANEAIPEAPMGGICVLPVSVWGNGQRHSQAEGFNSPQACINHLFRGSWKKGWTKYIFG
ncbi:glycosyltransferase family 32 protein, partial [Aspergillus carbonarius ITEM 5010]